MELADAAPSAHDVLAAHQRLLPLKRAIATLPERLQLMLSLYYVDEVTMKEIGALLGVTESRVCQLHAEAVKRIRAAMQSDAASHPLLDAA